MPSAIEIPVVDPYDVADDPALPTLASALDPEVAARRLRWHLARLAGDRRVELREIRVVRYKPGRRCLVEYDIDVPDGDGWESVTLIGKVQRGRFGNSGYRLLDALWHVGFDALSEDGISVPEPIATIRVFRMWLQRRVPGVASSELLADPGAEGLAERIAEAAHKLHRAGIPAERSHGIDDELRILERCLAEVARRSAVRAERTRQLMIACERLAACTPVFIPTGVHRDFYADQVIVDDDRLTLVDFDLYCRGDPALDIGNFLGHLTEQGLREHGDPHALASVENALEERFVELSGEHVRRGVRAYAALTLARHVFLSTQLPDRSHLTDPLLELATERVRTAGGAGVR